MSESKISIALVKRGEQKSRILRPVKVAIIMYKIFASVLAILLSTQMIVPLAYAAEESEGNAGKGSRDVGASELSGETALGAMSLMIPRASSTASGTTVSAASVEKGVTSSAAAKLGAAESAAHQHRLTGRLTGRLADLLAHRLARYHQQRTTQRRQRRRRLVRRIRRRCQQHQTPMQQSQRIFRSIKTQ